MDRDRDEPLISNSHPSGVLRAGYILGDRYRIEGCIGAGGMGGVYKATHIELRNTVAIKVMHSRFSVDQNAVARFHREAKIISGLHHKNILSVYSFGSADGLLYLAMEFIDGRSLGDLIREQKLRSQKNNAIAILLQICDAMAYAHHQHVLHRDLKPDNVLITKADQTAKVVDFGLAKLTDEEMQRLTSTGLVVGDPRYMSPEQSQGKPVDGRSDIYSFGCLMYELLAGRCPFDADAPVAILFKQISENPELFADETNLSRSLQAITLQCMQKDPQLRYQSFEEIAVQLQILASDPDAKVEGSHSKARAGAQKHPASPQKKRLLAVFTGVVITTLAGLCVLLLLTQSNSNTNATGKDQQTDHDLRQVLEKLKRSYHDEAKYKRESLEAESIASQNPGAVSPLYRGRLDYVHARVLQVETYRSRPVEKQQPGWEQALSYSRKSVVELKKARADDASSYSTHTRTATGLLMMKEEDQYFFDSILLWQAMAEKCNRANEVESSMNEIMDFCERFKIESDSAPRMTPLWQLKISRIVQTGDRTAAKTIAERYLRCLRKQGYKASFIDDQVRAVRALAGIDLPN